MVFDIKKIRKDFPILRRKKKNHPLIYLDNAATSHMPEKVNRFIYKCQRNSYATIHRGAYSLSEKISYEYEKSRKLIASFINAASQKEVLFNSGTSFGINFLAQSLGKNIKKGDEILITEMEHHSNYLPWYHLCEEKGALLKRIKLNSFGEIHWEDFLEKISEKTKILSIIHASNVLGTINPIKKIIKKAREYSVKVIVDGAQSIAHIPIDVQEMDCDFFVFSGHKIYGPSGVGVLYGKQKELENLPISFYGGGMVEYLDFDEKSVKYRPLPYRFEVGTPPIMGVLGLKKSIEYIQKIGLHEIKKHEDFLFQTLKQEMSKLDIIRIFSLSSNSVPILSFQIKGIHPHDVGSIFDEYFICIRSGQHCAQELMRYYNILEGTNRISFGIYNDINEIDFVLEVIKKVLQIFHL